MADTEVLKKLKDIPYRIQTAGLKERRDVVEEIQDVLSTPEITEPAVRFVCRVLTMTLHRYRDSKSQSYVRSLILHLVTNHYEWTLRNFLPLLLDISDTLRNTAATRSTCESGLFVLRWTTILTENSFKSSEEGIDYNPLILSQANLLTVIAACGNQKSIEKSFSLVHNAWKKIGVEKLLNWVLVLSAQAPDAGPQVPIGFSALCQHYRNIGNEDTLAEYKEKMLESFIKSLISVKARPNANYIKSCAELLHTLSKSDVKNTLLPALQKAMLRSPETITQAVGEVVANLEVDLENSIVDLAKNLIAGLNSKDEWVRTESQNALESIAISVRSVDVACAIVNQAFAFYNGSSGKLTSAEDKISVLQGIGALSEIQLQDPEAQKKVFALASEQFARVLAAECHERTLLHATRAMRRYSLRSRAPILIDVLQKQLSSKSTPDSVRVAYVGLITETLRLHPTANVQSLMPALQAAVAKGLQNTGQIHSVSEAVSALAAAGAAGAGQGAAPRWEPAQHAALLHYKQLTNMQPEVLIQVVWLCTSVLDKDQNVANDKDSPIYKALIYILLSTTKTVRDCAIEDVKKLLSSTKRSQIAKNLVAKLNEILEENKFLTAKEKTPSDEKGIPHDVTGKIITDCVHALCSYRDYSVEEKESIVLEALPACHHPLVVTNDKRAWIKLVKYLKLDPEKLVTFYASTLKDKYVIGFEPNETMSAIVSTLTLCGGEALGVAVQRCIDALTAPALLRVTRDEYFTFLTPPGDLYDKSAIPGNEDSQQMNMKRESKAYSYKDQLEEIQLRREILEKQKREGKIKEVPLSAKQKEAMKTQLAKEEAIRARLTELEHSVSCGCGLVRAAAAGGAGCVRLRARRLMPALLAALSSPLCAAQLVQLAQDLRPCLAPTLPDHPGRAMLRLHHPQCDLDPSWTEEPLDKAVVRQIEYLHLLTVGVGDCPGVPLAAPAFCYVWGLLERALESTAPELPEHAALQALAVLAAHAGVDEPALLPFDRMFTVLYHRISSSSGRAQAAAAAALLDAARGAAQAPVAASDVRCLLHALQADQQVVRDAALRALLLLAPRLDVLLDDAELAPQLTTRLYVATHDVNEENRELAKEVWCRLPELELRLGAAGALDALLAEVEQPSEELQRAAAAALAERAEPPLASHVLHALQAAYMAKLPLIPAKLDSFGHVVTDAVDEWAPRRGVAFALAALASRLSAPDVSPAMAFFVDHALADRSEQVRDAMLVAAMAVVDLHGKETLGSQLPVFENFLDKAPKSGGFDAVRQSVVLLVGSLARHLEPQDARVRPIALRLVQALSTPSQQVQEAVSNCLPHLVNSPALEQEIPTIVNKLIKQMLTADKYADRKGAAYGIAGIVKGLGILSLKQLDIMGRLTEAIQEKKNYKYREGALFGFEMLCHKLGRLFEPYVVHVLPHLLMCLGDGSQYVRAAADDAARLIMSRLSAHGVKLVLPALLHALDDDNWRTKAGSIELLGAMAYCAPKQLSSCLPSIVPRLIDVLSDSHVRVQAAAADALRVIGSVIRNPEIQAIVGVLLAALQDPSANTSTCLHTLLDTKFVHFIDAPSLALIMPVVQRAFLDRSTETRKMAAQIIGNMYSLTDQKDLAPYLPSIMPGLKSSLLDPVPEVRAVSARALGAMVRGMGESSFEELLPWLMHTLTSETSSVDRSGAAQGLSEVVAGLGVHKLHKIMPDIIATAERSDIAPHVKDGYIMMFIYMPGAFTDEFTPYIGQIIPPILQALADESEFVRDTALRAGQRIVNLYAESAIALLLPELERGLFADNWRIRYSSVQLLGDLLYRISGVSGKMSTETASDDDNFGTEQSHRAIITALGVERRNRVLAGLYMGRSDVALMVRQAALHVWKVVVTNTPKTLREILPTLFGLLLGCLASTSLDKRQVAARTLGDLVRKLGERVLPEIIPILERGLKSDRADQRQGVCIGLSEILTSTSRDAVLSFADGLVPTVRTALCDPLPPVRAAAAKTFDALHHAVGNKALDDILPALLQALHDPDAERADHALDGLKQIMAIKSRAVLPYLVPVVCAGGDTRALSALAAAAGPALARHLPRVLPALLDALAAAPAGRDNCRDALLPVTDPAGVRCIIDTLLEAWRTDTGARRDAAASLLCAYVSHARCDVAPHVPQLLRGLLALMCVPGDCLQPAWEALYALTKSLSPEQLLAHVSDMRHAVKLVAADLPPGELLPGFCLPKGIAPILPLFREAILNGMAEDKEAAALLLGEVIRLTSSQSLQSSVVHVTGPLIRILGDRFSCSIKAAVLDTLAALLSKVGVMLKQFLPQLQTTFLKSLHDPARGVRLRAGQALAQLVLIHTRADPLFSELCAALRSGDENRDTHLHALRLLLTAGGAKVSEPLALSLLSALTTGPCDLCGAGALGALVPALQQPHRAAALAHHVLAATDDAALAEFRAAALCVALRQDPDTIYCDQFEEKIEKAILSYMSSERPALAGHGVRCAAFLLRHTCARAAPPAALLAATARSMNHTSNEVKQVVATAGGLIVRAALTKGTPQAEADILRALIPALVNGTKEKQTLVRAQSELALRSALNDADTIKRASAALDAGARDALADVMARLTRRAADAAPPTDDDLDVTLVT